MNLLKRLFFSFMAPLTYVLTYFSVYISIYISVFQCKTYESPRDNLNVFLGGGGGVVLKSLIFVTFFIKKNAFFDIETLNFRNKDGDTIIFV